MIPAVPPPEYVAQPAQVVISHPPPLRMGFHFAWAGSTENLKQENIAKGGLLLEGGPPKENKNILNNSIGPQNQTIPSSLTQETVLCVKHWTDTLFSFLISRPSALRFRSGEFIMLGLFDKTKPLLRAYSITSPSWDETLEFYSIKVQEGPLTSRLQNIMPDDKILLGKKPTGTLILDALTPGENLYLFSTGTGIAPFASLIHDPETFDKFRKVILTHTCRRVAELEYGQNLIASVKEDPLVGELVKDRLTYFTSVTQEEYSNVGRITNLMESGEFYKNIGEENLTPNRDRVMICGSMEMLKDVSAIVEEKGLAEGSNANLGEYVIEKGFVG